MHILRVYHLISKYLSTEPYKLRTLISENDHTAIITPRSSSQEISASAAVRAVRQLSSSQASHAARLPRVDFLKSESNLLYAARL